MSKFVKLQIQGMKCTGCAASVEEKLNQIFDCSVDFDSKTAVVKSKDEKDIDVEALIQKLSDIGYESKVLN